MPSIDINVKLFFSDHRGEAYYDPVSRRGCVGALEVGPLMEGTNVGELIVSSAENATHLLVHLTLSERKMAKAGAWPKSINSDQIILCLTTLDGFDATEYSHRFD